MGILVNGEWRDQWYDTEASQGKFVRTAAKFRHWITADGSAGPSGEGGFTPDSGRYHLYVSYACPWANRTILYRKLKGLEDTITMSVAHPVWGSADGWQFADTDLSTRDHIACRPALRDIYVAAKPDFTGRVTVPVLWDKKTATIASNESGDIIRMLDGAFDAWGDPSVRFRPDDLADAVDAMNAVVLPKACMGVYKAGFCRNEGLTVGTPVESNAGWRDRRKTVHLAVGDGNGVSHLAVNRCHPI